MIMTNAKKQNEMRRKAEREAQGGSPAPAPVAPPKPRGLGGWAEMLGKLNDGEKPAFEKPAAAPTPWRNEAAFPPVPPLPPPPAPSFQTIKESVLMRSVSAEGADECHENMLTEPALETPEPVRFDGPALVKGVIFAEILTRPAQRRRPGMPRMR